MAESIKKQNNLPKQDILSRQDILPTEDKNDAKTEKSNEIKKNYNDRIMAIQRYYEISEIAAIYIYFRRKRSYPWKKKSDPKYLFWNAKLQNALILADTIFGFDWESLEYGKEEEMLKNYGIDINTQPNDLFRKKEEPNNTFIDEEGNEWQYVSKKKNVNPDELILQMIGLLPKKLR